MTATPWATVAQITTATGRVVTEDTRNMAAAAIELHTGLIEEVERVDLTDRDRYWLRLAVAYQAVWLLAQPDYLERNAVANIAQDGQSAAMGNADWLTLAPLARKAIKRLSWRGPRAIMVPDEAVRRARLDALLETTDDYLTWRPL